MTGTDARTAPPEALAQTLRRGEELFTWAHCQTGSSQGTLAITSDRLLFLGDAGGKDRIEARLLQDRKVGLPQSDTVKIALAKGELVFTGLEPSVAKEIAAIVMPPLAERLFPGDAEMLEKLQVRQAKINERKHNATDRPNYKSGIKQPAPTSPIAKSGIKQPAPTSPTAKSGIKQLAPTSPTAKSGINQSAPPVSAPILGAYEAGQLRQAAEQVPAPANSSGSGLKTCPMCAEEIKADALVCRFCGHRFNELLPAPTRPSGPPPETLTGQLRTGETLFVWSPGMLRGGSGIIAITSDRVMCADGSVSHFQNPIDRPLTVTMSGNWPGEPPGCRLRIKFDGGQGFDFHRLNPSVANEMAATVDSRWIDKLYGDDEAMKETLRARHDQIVARKWWHAVTPGTILTKCHPWGTRGMEVGSLVATEVGLIYTGRAGGEIPWQKLAKLELLESRTQRGGSGRRRAIGIGPVGVALVAATMLSNGRPARVEVHHILRTTDTAGRTVDFWVRAGDLIAAQELISLMPAS